MEKQCDCFLPEIAATSELLETHAVRRSSLLILDFTDRTRWPENEGISWNVSSRFHTLIAHISMTIKFPLETRFYFILNLEARG